MPSTRELRRSMRSVRNISQVTRAMEMVSASKMRRAQQRVIASRPYSERLQDVIADLASLQLDASDLTQFPLLQQREVKRSAVVLITPDKGLTGPLVSHLLRQASHHILQETTTPVEVITVGRKGRDFMTRTQQDVIAEFTNLGDHVSLDDIRPIAQIAIDEFVSGKVDSVSLLYAQFVNTLVQKPIVQQMLPITRPEGHGEYTDYIFEPSPVDVLQSLLPRFVEIQIYHAMLESIASEHSARMVAMRNATDNAKELLTEYTLSYNKARQTQITNEVAEIAAGANALGAG